MGFDREIQNQLGAILQNEADARQKEIDAANQLHAEQSAIEAKAAAQEMARESESARARANLEKIFKDTHAMELLQDVRQKWGVGTMSWEYIDYKSSEHHYADQELHLVLSYDYPDVEDRGSTYYPATGGGDGLGGGESWDPPDYYIGSSSTKLEIVAKRYTYQSPDVYVMEVHDDGPTWSQDDGKMGLGYVIDIDLADPAKQQEALRKQLAGYTAKRIHENALPLQLEQTARENIHQFVPFKRRVMKGF